jgi:TubC N-terminal docking domain
MSAAAILADARRLGIRLTARGDRLAFDAPRDAFTPEMREALATHKLEILALLRAEQQADSLPEPSTPSGPVPGAGAVPTGSDEPADRQTAPDRMRDKKLDAWYAMIRDDRSSARRVTTPRGPGNLWQNFVCRVGVVLDSDPRKVAAYRHCSKETGPAASCRPRLV